jgi:hypothetical protein
MALKLCPSCRSEYVSAVERCADCGCALVFADQFVPLPEAEPGPSEELPPATELALVRTGSPAQLGVFAELLQEFGISSRVDAYPPGAEDPDSEVAAARRAARGAGIGPTLGLYVRERDLVAAVDAVEAQLAAEMPDAVQLRERGEASECPACSAPLGAEDTACSDCGLEFPSQS